MLAASNIHVSVLLQCCTLVLWILHSSILALILRRCGFGSSFKAGRDTANLPGTRIISPRINAICRLGEPLKECVKGERSCHVTSSVSGDQMSMLVIPQVYSSSGTWAPLSCLTFVSWSYLKIHAVRESNGSVSLWLLNLVFLYCCLISNLFLVPRNF